MKILNKVITVSAIIIVFCLVIVGSASASNGSWSNDPFAIRDFVNSVGVQYGYNHVPDGYYAGAMNFDNATALKICQLAGFNKVVSKNCVSKPEWDNRCGFASCYNDTLAKWNSSANDFSIINACSAGNKWIASLVCGNNAVSICASNADCGTDGFNGNAVCGLNGDVYKNYTTYTCTNPGMANSSCSHADEQRLFADCATNQICSNGSCANQNFVCTTNADCSAQNGYIGSPFCQSGNSTGIFQTFRTYSCQNGGTVNSSCVPTDAAQKKNDCTGNQTCSNGNCVTQNIQCSSASSCGANGYTGSPFCSNGDVYQNFTTWTCNNPGVANSSCSSNTAPQLKTNCTGNQTCSNGSCSTSCTTHSYQQCSGNYLYWYNSCGSREDSYQHCPNGCSGNICSNQNCADFSYKACYDNAVYWYDSCGNRDGLFQTCNYNQTCQNGQCQNNYINNCTSHSSQRCVGNYLYWYDSCGNQQGQGQFCQNGCSGNACSNNNNNYSNLIVTTTVKNLSTGLGWYSNVAASPSDVLMFMVTLHAQGNQNVNSVYVRDTLPYGLIYRNSLIVSGTNNYNYNSGGDITSGLSIGTILAGQTVTITYQAQVASSGNFSYGTSTITDNVFATASGGTPTVNNATVTVTRSAVYGATNISTGLTNNFWVDSFFLPLLITLIILWMWKSGMFLGIEKWLGGKKKVKQNYSSESELKNRIALIQKTEKV